MELLFTVGPIGISTDPGLELTTVGDRRFKRLVANIMIARRRQGNGLRLARASMQDIEAVEALIDSIDGIIDELNDSPDQAIWRLERLADKAACAKGRVLFGLETLLDNCTDPNIDYLDFSPEIKKGVWLQRRLSWLTGLMEAAKFEPWQN